MSRFKCMKCGMAHKLAACTEFRKMSVEKRREYVKEKNLCFSCCNPNHSVKSCREKRTCNIDGCISKHNRLLHLKTNDTPKTETKTVNGQINYHAQNRSKAFFQILPVTLSNGNNKIKTYIFFDSASSVSLIDQNIVNELNLTGVRNPVSFVWTNGCIQEENDSQIVQVKAEGSNGKTFLLRNLCTIKALALPIQSVNARSLEEKHPYLKGTNLDSYENVAPTILIGQPHAYLFKALEERSGGFNEPIATKTRLGWVLFGSSRTSPRCQYDNMNHVFILNQIDDEEKSIREMMPNYFSTEAFGVKVPSNALIAKTDERALKIMGETLRATENGYEIGLLWKKDKVELPDSFETALKRFLQQEQKLEKDQPLKTWYHEKINEYVAKGYLKKLSPEEYMIENPKTFYLPHFIAINKNKQKPSMVFDAAAKIEGISLNSQLLSGPDMTASSLGIKMCFRENSIAIAGDI